MRDLYLPVVEAVQQAVNIFRKATPMKPKGVRNPLRDWARFSVFAQVLALVIAAQISQCSCR